ncbi:glycosyltransferase [Cohnella zeiphila]|uniref:Glycosyltransferase n=1 Tax=Cohnella zeiphila TaxID=2761120 RepID=A0A7X0VZV5_9BACL|nr:glycosyltransferase [Cohnella zeiphila]MBB6734363.1 glycosyltransferase [Cohnella zeiphila]
MAVIVVPPGIDWNWMKQRPQQLMERLAAHGHVVCYCDRTRSAGAAEPVAERIAPRLYRIRHHERWLAELWPSFRRQRQDPVIVWCCTPADPPAQLRERYRPDFIVYDCADDVPEWYPREQPLAAEADLIVCSSERLLERWSRSFPGKPVRLVRNGYDPRMGLHLPPGEDDEIPPAEANGKRLIGYVGAWAPWIDAALLCEVARLPNAEVIVIGPEFGRKYSGGGVRFLGMMPHDRLAGWIRRLSVCLVPFHMTPIALAADPIKAYEYLAAGKPVVATDLPECRRMRPHVDVAANRREFVRAVARRLDDPGDEAARRTFALNSTWDRRGADADAVLRSLSL